MTEVATQQRLPAAWMRIVSVSMIAVGLTTIVSWIALAVASVERFNYAPTTAKTLAVLGWFYSGWATGRANEALICEPILARQRVSTAGMVAFAQLLGESAASTVLGIPVSAVVPRPALTSVVATLLGLVWTWQHPRVFVGVDRKTRRELRLIGVGALTLLLVLTHSPQAPAWIASARLKQPTVAMKATGGIDLRVDTHQWIANQAIEILRNDGQRPIATFLDSADANAPGTTPRIGPFDGPFTYRWRLLRGASDADGTLYPHVRDHFHNFWTHRGRQWVLGPSAASNAENAFDRAVSLWKGNERGEAMYWLGASLHLLEDACVPQHQFFAVNVYHHQYEVWVRRYADRLAVNGGAITKDQFRVGDGHGGDDWSSDHPRGWVDECAHRSIQQIQATTHPNGPDDSKPTDPRWQSAAHVADTQRLAAGYIQFFFSKVGTP